jgi:hypothetical protein
MRQAIIAFAGGLLLGASTTLLAQNPSVGKVGVENVEVHLIELGSDKSGNASYQLRLDGDRRIAGNPIDLRSDLNTAGKQACLTCWQAAQAAAQTKEGL